MTTFLEDLQHLTLREFSTPKAKDLKFQESNKKPEAESYELKPGIIRIAAENLFSGEDDENPYKHLEKLNQVCRTFHQDGVPVEWVKWNLFPFTLVDKAKRWYQVAAIEAQGDWQMLEQKFLTKFFSILRVHKLRKEVWNFEQKTDEDIDEAWERLNDLLLQGPPLGVTPEMAIHIFFFGLTSEAFKHVNTCAGGSLMSHSSKEATRVLSNIFLTSKSERERKDRRVKEPDEELMAPTPAMTEDQLSVKKTPISYAFDEEEFERFAPQEDIKSVEYISLSSAKPLTEFERMS